jgi:hypothetical protein
MSSVLASVTYTTSEKMQPGFIPDDFIIKLALVNDAAELNWKQIVRKAALQEGWHDLELSSDWQTTGNKDDFLDLFPDVYSQAYRSLANDGTCIAVRKHIV